MRVCDDSRMRASRSNDCASDLGPDVRVGYTPVRKSPLSKLRGQVTESRLVALLGWFFTSKSL